MSKMPNNDSKGDKASGLIHFFGVVESIEGDPLELGRAKVRVINQTDNGTPPDTEKLQWCTVLGPITSPSNGTGASPTWLQIGTKVFGVYLDGKVKRMPLLIGTLYTIPGMDINKHGISKLARGENNLAKEIVGPEPESAYAAKYPYNKVIDTPGGHAIELDDTPGEERIHIYHKSGTYIEINKEGQTVRKSVGNDFQIVALDSDVYVGGKSNVYILGDTTVKIDGNYSIETGGNMDFKAGGNITMNGSKISLN